MPVLNRWLLRALLALSPFSVLVAACSKGDALSPTASSPPSHACSAQHASSPTPSPKPSQLTVVHADPNASAPFQLALQACAGLQNRKVAGSVYVEADPHDPAWRMN